MSSRKAQDALDLLDADHSAVKQLIDAYRELAANEASAARRKALAEQICMALTIHTELQAVPEALREEALISTAA